MPFAPVFLYRKSSREIQRPTSPCAGESLAMQSVARPGDRVSCRDPELPGGLEVPCRYGPANSSLGEQGVPRMDGHPRSKSGVQGGPSPSHDFRAKSSGASRGAACPFEALHQHDWNLPDEFGDRSAGSPAWCTTSLSDRRDAKSPFDLAPRRLALAQLVGPVRGY